MKVFLVEAGRAGGSAATLKCGEREADACRAYEEFRIMLGCSRLDTAEKDIGGTIYEVVADDEGARGENPVVSLIAPDGHIFYGSLIISRRGPDGREQGLAEGDARMLSAMMEQSVRLIAKMARDAAGADAAPAVRHAAGGGEGGGLLQ